MRSTIFAMLTFLSMVAAAKGKAMQINYSSEAPLTSSSIKENRVMLDAAPLLMSGLGLAYERTLLAQLTVGPYISVFKLTSDPEKNNGASFQSDVRMYGVRARYFLSEEAERSGIYVMAGVGAVDVKTAATYTNLSADANSTALGGIGGAGYQLMGSDLANGKMAFNLGATYANGYEVKNQARFYPNSRAEVDTPKAAGSIFVEGNVAFLF